MTDFPRSGKFNLAGERQKLQRTLWTSFRQRWIEYFIVDMTLTQFHRREWKFTSPMRKSTGSLGKFIKPKWDLDTKENIWGENYCDLESINVWMMITFGSLVAVAGQDFTDLWNSSWMTWLHTYSTPMYSTWDYGKSCGSCRVRSGSCSFCSCNAWSTLREKIPTTKKLILQSSKSFGKYSRIYCFHAFNQTRT